ncbi:hypothetical protein OMAG_001594 [Candidatus Omnitrophus magneticus]|uniref:Uncharacterized protein n=1 Tax=Candidatus Omnitrophus magneticus TaxID=1609969 RepID=A0A0F0CRA0_9BACT|nr:hypothetical protein OMAG_001594 [Candidatus Omnitrophus magneticus]
MVYRYGIFLRLGYGIYFSLEATSATRAFNSFGYCIRFFILTS